MFGNTRMAENLSGVKFDIYFHLRKNDVKKKTFFIIYDHQFLSLCSGQSLRIRVKYSGKRVGRDFEATASGAAGFEIFFGFWPKSAPELMSNPKKGSTLISHYIPYNCIKIPVIFDFSQFLAEFQLFRNHQISKVLRYFGLGEIWIKLGAGFEIPKNFLHIAKSDNKRHFLLIVKYKINLRSTKDALLGKYRIPVLNLIIRPSQVMKQEKFYTVLLRLPVMETTVIRSISLLLTQRLANLSKVRACFSYKIFYKVEKFHLFFLFSFIKLCSSYQLSSLHGYCWPKRRNGRYRPVQLLDRVKWIPYWMCP